MKKLIAMLLALVLVLSFAACGKTNDAQEPAVDNEVVETPAVGSPLEVLESIWALYSEDEKFPVIGGDFENAADGQPGEWDSAKLEDLAFTAQLPADQVANVAQAATMIHMMNANTFTAVAYGLAEGVDAAAFAQAARDGVMNAQWMCGFPELLEVAVIDGYVVVAYGLTDAITPFRTHLAEAFANAQILFSESIG